MNLRHGFRWMANKIKPMPFAAITILLSTFFAYYIVSEEATTEDSKMDIFKFSFVFAIVWCVSGWLGCRIGQKLDGKPVKWQVKLLGIIIGGPVILSMSILDYLKQKKQAKYTSRELLGCKKDFRENTHEQRDKSFSEIAEQIAERHNKDGVTLTDPRTGKDLLAEMTDEQREKFRQFKIKNR